MKLRTTLAVLALAAFTSVASADITGKVTLEGKAPEQKEIDMSGVKECAALHADPITEQAIVADDKGNLANVIVAIKKAEGQDLPGDPPAEPATLDQKGCMYEPHVLVMMAGQEFIVRNDDPFLHNVHSLATVNPAFNFGQPNKDEGKKVDPLKAEEYFPVKCDVHPWMRAYVGVFEHPYFAVTKEDGTFAIKADALPDGEYTLTFWHEKLATEPVETKINVAGGKAEANHAFKAEAALAEPADATTAILASADGKKDDCADGKCCAASASKTALLKNAAKVVVAK
ncbi:MAG: hypothetical protein ABIP55_10350 [Tepidisphaeraceae bacterium]